MGGKTFNQPIIDAINNLLKTQSEIITVTQNSNAKITAMEKQMVIINKQLQQITDEDITPDDQG